MKSRGRTRLLTFDLDHSLTRLTGQQALQIRRQLPARLSVSTPFHVQPMTVAKPFPESIQGPA